MASLSNLRQSSKELAVHNSSSDNTADILTKLLNHSNFVWLCQYLGLCSPREP